ncbi:MAG: T9SS type A sorting domain-containing protein [Fibromonadaceae bacterium]|jgi:hypothetical protein|nr:T9SS type A sorting domain-containing protein [Fibromonadaceae bacterium]
MKAFMFGFLFLLAAFSAVFAQNSTVENEGVDCSVTISGNGAITANSNLPDPFMKMNGQRMTAKDEWICRRQEIRKLLEKTVYGEMKVTPFSATTGTVSKTSISVTVSDNGKTATFTASVDLPSGNGPFPAMIIYGGFGGPSASTLKNQGVAVITFDPAKGGAEGTNRNNKSGAYYTLYGANSNLGILAAQAWAVSRIIDVIQKSDGSILKWDAIGVTGCSRYGKGSFVAGVFDQRIALTMPIESGTGGVPIMRSVSNENKQSLSSAYGEQPWLGDVFSTFQNSPNTLPTDMHGAVAMVAPRGLLILDNPHIANLGPRSAHLSAVAGGEVYKALGYGGNITYFSNSADGNHCTFQPEFSTPLTTNINKFLKKQGSAVGGDPTINPRSGVTGNTALINWTTPTLTGTYPPSGSSGSSSSIATTPSSSSRASSSSSSRPSSSSSSSTGSPAVCGEYQTSYCGGLAYGSVPSNSTTMPTTGNCLYIGDFEAIQPNLNSTVVINGVENTCGSDWENCPFNTKSDTKDGGYYVYVKTGTINSYQNNGWKGIVAKTKPTCVSSSSSAAEVSSSSQEDPTPIISNIPLTYFSAQALNGVVEIFDIKGNKVASVNVSDPQAVKLSLPSGLYFAKARGMQSIKFVVK